MPFGLEGFHRHQHNPWHLVLAEEDASGLAVLSDSRVISHNHHLANEIMDTNPSTNITLPETNIAIIAPWKIGHPKRKGLSSKPSICRRTVSFREGGVDPPWSTPQKSGYCLLTSSDDLSIQQIWGEIFAISPSKSWKTKVIWLSYMIFSTYWGWCDITKSFTE